MVSADTLILLSDVDGLYTGDPRRHPGAELIAELDGITPEIEAMAGPAAKGVSSGGMRTKIAAGKVALAAIIAGDWGGEPFG